MASFRRSLFAEIWHTPTIIPCTHTHKKNKNKKKKTTENGYVVINVHSVMVCVYKLQ